LQTSNDGERKQAWSEAVLLNQYTTEALSIRFWLLADTYTWLLFLIDFDDETFIFVWTTLATVSSTVANYSCVILSFDSRAGTVPLIDPAKVVHYSETCPS
ncbi:hypothetical protein Tcan_00719, partial [Toxocara canis]